jgi:ABC-type multidrug transport system ATPase subunit
VDSEEELPDMSTFRESLPTEAIQLVKVVRNEIQIVDSSIDILCGIKEKIKVISITGPINNGKSTLLKVMMDRGEEKSETEGKAGIWMWINPIEIPEGILIVFDTEGNTASSNETSLYPKLMAIEFLLSSALLFNTTGSIDENAIKELSVLTSIPSLISF